MSGRVTCVACVAALFVVLQPILSVVSRFQPHPCPRRPHPHAELGVGQFVTDFGVHGLHSLHSGLIDSASAFVDRTASGSAIASQSTISPYFIDDHSLNSRPHLRPERFGATFLLTFTLALARRAPRGSEIENVVWIFSWRFYRSSWTYPQRRFMSQRSRRRERCIPGTLCGP